MPIAAVIFIQNKTITSKSDLKIKIKLPRAEDENEPSRNNTVAVLSRFVVVKGCLSAPALSEPGCEWDARCQSAQATPAAARRSHDRRGRPPLRLPFRADTCSTLRPSLRAKGSPRLLRRGGGERPTCNFRLTPRWPCCRTPRRAEPAGAACVRRGGWLSARCTHYGGLKARAHALHRVSFAHTPLPDQSNWAGSPGGREAVRRPPGAGTRGVRSAPGLRGVDDRQKAIRLHY